VRITAIDASMPMSFQFGAMAVRTMSAASMNSRPSSSQRARLNHAARRMPCVAALRSSGITICDNASSAPIEIISTDTASRASAMPLLISRKSSSIAAGQLRTTHRNPRCEVDVSIGCAMRAAGR
jgi:hypothetical protein